MSEWGTGDGPLTDACRFAVQLRRRGAGEAIACESAAKVYGVEATDIMRAVGFKGAAATFERRARLAGYARARR